jgi:hypothetical protein
MTALAEWIGSLQRRFDSGETIEDCTGDAVVDPFACLNAGDTLDKTIQEAEALVVKLLRMKADGLKMRPISVPGAMDKLRVLVTDNPAVAKKMEDGRRCRLDREPHEMTRADHS